MSISATPSNHSGQHIKTRRPKALHHIIRASTAADATHHRLTHHSTTGIIVISIFSLDKYADANPAQQSILVYDPQPHTRTLSLPSCFISQKLEVRKRVALSTHKTKNSKLSFFLSLSPHISFIRGSSDQSPAQIHATKSKRAIATTTPPFIFIFWRIAGGR